MMSTLFSALRRSALRRRRDEEGATAVVVTFLAIALFAAAALAVDYSTLTMEKQRLHDHVDAAAHAGAYELPNNGTGAEAVARAMARSMDPAIDPDVDLWCVIKSDGGAPVMSQIPGTCDPANPSLDGMRCNDKICAIPCFPARGGQCNAMRVTEEKTVPFGFGRIVGLNEGNTGAVTTLACKGSCGEEVPNPLDVMIMADRTTSMSQTDRRAMVDGIRTSLMTMNPDLHYVAIGTLNKSRKPGDRGYRSTCITDNIPTGGQDATSAQAGTWVPSGFSNTYRASADATTLNPTDRVVQALNCIYNQDTSNNLGTPLGGAAKGAARYLLGWDSNNLGSLPGGRPGEVKKVLIFETDGQPDEVWEGGSSTLSRAGDVAYGYQRYTSGRSSDAGNGIDGCAGMRSILNQAKEQGVLVITVGFGAARLAGCEKVATDSNGMPINPRRPWVRDYLAEAASPAPDGTPSQASTCDTEASRSAENSDGDYYFCAATGSELADVFSVAISQATSSIRYLQMP
jgi:hypothetical protein